VCDKKLIRDRRSVRGGAPYEGGSLCAWEVNRSAARSRTGTAPGDLTTGSVDETAGGIVFPQKHETANGAMEVETIYTRPQRTAHHVWVGNELARTGRPFGLWASSEKPERDQGFLASPPPDGAAAPGALISTFVVLVL